MLAGTVAAQNYNGLALTPPMGWNSYNKYGGHVTDALVRQTGHAMVTSGMAAVGYKFVNIDDCWQLKGRDAQGHMLPHRSSRATTSRKCGRPPRPSWWPRRSSRWTRTPWVSKASVVSNANQLETLSKPLVGGNVRAVALFNRGTATTNISVTWSQLGLPAGSYAVRDLWAQKDLGSFATGFTATAVASSATVVLRISPPTTAISHRSNSGSSSLETRVENHRLQRMD